MIELYYRVFLIQGTKHDQTGILNGYHMSFGIGLISLGAGGTYNLATFSDTFANVTLLRNLYGFAVRPILAVFSAPPL
jgi:hypothetical protein